MVTHNNSVEFANQILVLSLAFDGCIFNKNYINSGAANRLIDCNEIFFNYISHFVAENQFDRIILLVGSNRQSKEIDLFNSGTKGSCYPAILKISEELSQRTGLNCTVDRYLLADTYGDRPSGENFTNALTEGTYPFSNFVWDSGKTTILYAQMHKIALENPHANITYHFYDDLDKVLFHLSYFYHEELDLIPNKLILKLFLYNGTELSAFEDYLVKSLGPSISGKGITDSQFQDNIKFMALCCGYTLPYTPRMGRDEGISSKLDNDCLEKFKNEKFIRIDNLSSELDFCVQKLEQTRYKQYENLMQTLQPFIAELKLKLNALDQQFILGPNLPASKHELIFTRMVLKLSRELCYADSVYVESFYENVLHKALTRYLEQVIPAEVTEQKNSYLFFNSVSSSDKLHRLNHQFSKVLESLKLETMQIDKRLCF